MQPDVAFPQTPALRADMALLHASFDQAAEALRQFDLCVNTHQKDARLAIVLNERCWMRARLTIDYQLALQVCKQAVDMDKGEAAFQDSLGWTCLRLGDDSRAKKAFDSAIKLAALPLSPCGRGLTQLRLSDTASSEQDLAEARNLRPSVDEDARKDGFEFVDRAAQPAVPGT